MRSMTFLVNDRSAGDRPSPAVAVTLTENADGSVSFSIKVLGPVTGDLRGFFFDVANESLIGTLSVTPTSSGFTEFRQGNDSVRDLGNGANMNGLLGSDGGYDAGVEIGKAGTRKGDDYQSFSFTVSSSAGPLTLDDFANVDIGVRVNSVEGGWFCGDRDRDGEAKLLERTAAAYDAKDDAGALTEDAPVNTATGNVFGNDLNVKPVHLITAVNGSAANIGDEIQGTYGSLRLNLNGSYTYTLDNSRAATQALAAGQHVVESFTYTAKSFDELTSFSSDGAQILITITGADDNAPPVITAAVAAGAVTELADDAPGEGALLHSATGTVDFSDANTGDTHTLSVAAAGAGYLGAFSAAVTDSATGDGIGQVTWSFEVADGAIEHLGEGESLTQSYTLTLDDGHGGTASQLVTITITGANDAPVITGGTTAGAVAEDGALAASGDVDFTDLDLSDVHSVATTPAADDYLGTLTTAVGDDSTGDGVGEVTWSFTVSDAEIAHLGEGDGVTQTYHVNVDDGHGGTATQDVTITLTGANDAPEIVVGDTTGQVFEDGSRRDSGQLVAQDVDRNSTLTWTVDNPSVVATPDYRFLIDNLSIVRNGALYFNDDFGNNQAPPQAPNLIGTTTPVSYGMQGSFVESGGRAILDGSLSVPINNLGAPQPFHGNAAVLLTDTSSNLDLGLKIDDSFTVEGRFDLALPAEELQAYGVRLIDIDGSDLVDVRVRHDDDGVVRVVMREVDVPTNGITILSSVALEPLTGENQIVLRLTHNAADPGAIHASFDLLGGAAPRSFALGGVGHIFGTGTSGVPGDDEVFTRAQITASGPSDLQNGVYGTLHVDDAGAWSYALDNAAPLVQALAQGEHVTDTFTVRVADEHGASDTQTVSIDVVGSNDAPLISNASTSNATVSEDAVAVGGQIIATDIDHGAALEWSVARANFGQATSGTPGLQQLFGYQADFHYTLDQLTVTRNGSVVFSDPFGDGNPPPSAPSFAGFPASYVVAGAHTESGGRLQLDGSVAASQRGIENPALTVGHFTILATNIDPNDPLRGLKSDDDFTVETRYDLAMPPAGGAYGITLSDNTTGGLPPDQLGDSSLSLLVRASASGQVFVQLADFNVVTDDGTVFEAIPLAPLADETQIALRVMHDADHAGIVHAEFDLIGASGTRTFAFTGEAHIFGSATPDYAGDDENWTRVQLVAFGPDINAHTTSLPGNYGTLTVQQNGQWSYELNSNAQTLGEFQTDTDFFSVRVTDEFGVSAFRPVIITVQGANDAPAPSGGVASGEVAEDGQLTASGTVTFHDPDRFDLHGLTASFIGSTLGSGPLGTFLSGPLSEPVGPVDGSIPWTYTLDNAAAQFLNSGQTVVETYRLFINDFHGGSTTQDITVTILGADDVVQNTPPVAVDDTNDGDPVVEAGAFQPGDAFASGNVLTNDTDPDFNPGLHVVSVNGMDDNVGLVSGGNYGTLVLNADGSWNYHLDDSYPETNALAQGETAFEHFTYIVWDAQNAGDEGMLTIAITGTNDAPTVSGETTGATAEDAWRVARGQLAATDPDHGGTVSSWGIASPAAFGAVSVDGTGRWTYSLNDLPSTGGFLVQQLAQGQVLVDSFSVVAEDEHGAPSAPQVVTVQITGTNDRPFVNSPAVNATISEDALTPSTGQATAFDVDNGAVLSWSLSRGTSFGYSADYLFNMDRFSINKNGATIFDDGFSDGTPPPSAPNFSNGDPANYLISGAYGEANGELVLSGNATVGFTGVGFNGLLVGNNAILNTNIEPANLSLGLKSNHDFAVEGIFDLALPDELREGYGIQLSDSVNGAQGVGLLGDDQVSLIVRRNSATGELQVQLLDSNTAADTTVIQGVPLAPGADQIRLRLTHDNENPGLVLATYDYLTAGTVTGGGTVGTAHIFGSDTPGGGDDENWTRAGFLGIGPDQFEHVTTLAGSYGTLAISPSGQWSYAINPAAADPLAQGEVATDRFHLRITDEFGLSNSQPLSITVSGANDAPVAGDDSYTEGVGEDAATSLSVLNNDDDVDNGAVLTVVAGGPTARGATVSVNPDGSVRYDPTTSAELQALASGESRVDTFTYELRDQHGAVDTATVSVTVHGADEAPVEPAGAVAEDGSRHASGELTPPPGVDPDAALTWTVDNASVLATPDYRFLIDNFSIFRNGSTYFNDDFGSGGPPPQAPNLFGTTTPISYGTQGSFIESGNRAILDGSGSVQVASVGSPDPFHGTSALLLTDGSSDLSLGLKIDDNFTVEGRFDLVFPQEELQSYGVRLIDPNGSDTVDVRVRLDADGVVRVVMREVDVPTNTITVLASADLVPLAGQNQIALQLNHNAAQPGSIQAAFQLLGGAVFTDAVILGGVGHIFGTGTPGDPSDDEVFTRAQIVAVSPSDHQNGAYGTLRVNDAGEWTYALDNFSSAVQSLAQGERATDTFQVSVSDGLGGMGSRTVAMEVVGSNEAPLVTSAPVNAFNGGYVREDGPLFQQVVTGTASGIDTDHGASLHWSASRAPYSSNYQFRLDDITVTKGGSPIINDGFDNGSAPPSLPPGAPAGFGYLVNGTVSETGGRLVFNGQSGAVAQRGVGLEDLMVGQLITLGTNIDPADLTRGLKSDDDFGVTARYDLIVPAFAGQSYGVSLTDNVGGALPPDQLGDDVITLDVMRESDTSVRVRLLDRDVVADRTTVLESMVLTPVVGEDQIVLRLEHAVSDPGTVHASIDLLMGGALSRHMDFAQAAHIFGTDTPGYAGDDEDWTRVQLIAIGPDQGGTFVQGTYGSFNIDPSTGAWTYALDNSLPAVQNLAHGAVAIDPVNVRLVDEYGMSTSRAFNFAVVGMAEGATPAAPTTVVPDTTLPNQQVITGTSGADFIAGGAGADLLIGLDGADTFDYNNMGDANDTISDFNPAQGDKLDLHDLLLSLPGYVPGGTDPASLIFFNEFPFPGQRPGSALIVDQDGAPGGTLLQVALLEGASGLNAHDLIASGNLIV